jgi:hypothetical protein
VHVIQVTGTLAIGDDNKGLSGKRGATTVVAANPLISM